MQDVVLKVSQAVNVVKVVPTITSTPYSAGDSVGGIQTVTNAIAPRGTGQLHSLCILDKQNQKAAFDILIFEVSPNVATTTDNSAFAWSTDDLHLIGRIAIASADWVTVASEAICQKVGLDISLQASSGFNFYAVPVTSGTPTYAAGGLQFVWGTVAS